MRTSILLAAWASVALLLPAPATGQDALPTDKPYIFFSASPNVSGDSAPDKPLRKLNLRPNQDSSYFVYVHNPLKDKASVKVQLVSGPAGKLVVAAEKTVDVPGKQTVRVPLVADKAQLPPTLPPANGPDGKPLPAPAPTIPLGVNPFVRAVVADADGNLEEKGATITRVDVAAYTTVTVTNATNNGGKLKIVVKRQDVNLIGAPIAVQLTPRTKTGEPIAANLLAVEGNVLEGVLAIAADADGAQAVELTLATAGLPADGFAELSIDGYARAGWYGIDGSDKPAPFGVSAPAAAMPGKPLTVHFLAPKDGTDLKVVFDRTGTPAGEQIKTIPTPRNESISVRVGDNGEAVLVTRSTDWAVEFPTKGVFGTRNFFGKSGATASPKTPVMFDATGPGVDLLDAEPITADPKKATQRMFRPGQKVRVIASGKDDESKIDAAKGVVLYMGDKPGPDGKAAPGSQVKVGKPIDGGRFAADFEIPATTTVPEVKIGAIFVNGVGLPGGREAEIKVDYTPPEVSILNFDPAKAPLAAYKPGDTVRLIASAFDPESGVDLGDDVQFFLGDPPGPDGKPVQTTFELKKAAGVIKDKKGPHGEHLYAAELTLPKDIKKETEVKVGVMFVNRVGLYGFRVATVKLDKDFTTATLTVKVTQGAERRQPGIKVWLVDQNGNVAAEGKTDECGIAVFQKVLPGTYVVWGVKDADQNAQDWKTVVARGGDEIDVDLSVKRQLSPPIQPPKPPQR